MNRRVLLVDDDTMLISSMKRCLGMRFDLTTAQSGEEALGKIHETGPFAVVLTDMRMPKMNGVEFIREARQLAPDSTYMMLTGNQDASTPIRAVNEGEVKRYFNKPCDLEEMSQAIEESLQEMRLRDEREQGIERFVAAVAALHLEASEAATPQQIELASAVARNVKRLAARLGVETPWQVALTPSLFPLSAQTQPETPGSLRGVFHEVAKATRESPELDKLTGLLDEVAAAPAENLSVDAALLLVACVVALEDSRVGAADPEQRVRDATAGIDDRIREAAVELARNGCAVPVASMP